MDLNELLHAHQVEVMRANAAGDVHGRQSHFDKVIRYAEQIRLLRQTRQPTGLAPPPAPVDTIVYGSYAGDPTPNPPVSSLDSWESEGGALDSHSALWPDGIIVRVIREYHVGPYIYQDLTLAQAERARRLLDVSHPR